MFSEYTSRYLTQSQRPAPLFNREPEHLNYLSSTVNSTDLSLTSSSDSDSIDSDEQEHPLNPPRSLLTGNKREVKSGFSLFRKGEVGETGNGGVEGGPSGGPSGPTSAPISTPTPTPPSPHRTPFTILFSITLILTLPTALFYAVSTNTDLIQYYPIISDSIKPMFVYFILSNLLAISYLFLLVSYPIFVVKSLVYLVPTFFSLISVFAFFNSFSGNHFYVHTLLRFFSFVPILLSFLFVKFTTKYNQNLIESADLIGLSSKVFNQMRPAVSKFVLYLVFFTSDLMQVWAMFLGIAFLRGAFGYLFLIVLSFVFLWTLNVMDCVAKAMMAVITKETFVLNNLFDSKGLFRRAWWEVVTYHFESCCFSGLLQIIEKVKFVGKLVQFSQLLNPLTLPTAVINQQSLKEASELATPKSRTYVLASLFLYAGRLTSAFLFGFLAWVHADKIQDSSSVYGFEVGLAAFLMAYFTVGSVEKLLRSVVDAIVVCDLVGLHTITNEHERSEC